MTKREFLEHNDFNNRPLVKQIELFNGALDLKAHPNESEMFIQIGGGRSMATDELKQINAQLLIDFPRLKDIAVKHLEIIRRFPNLTDPELDQAILQELRSQSLDHIL